MFMRLLSKRDTEMGKEEDTVPTPSKPCLLTISATFFAYCFLPASSLEPAENPAVSPQPPIAISSLVPFAKRPRISLMGANGVYSPGGLSMKRLLFAKAMIAQSTPVVISLPGRMVLCHLHRFWGSSWLAHHIQHISTSISICRDGELLGWVLRTDLNTRKIWRQPAGYRKAIWAL